MAHIMWVLKGIILILSIRDTASANLKCRRWMETLLCHFLGQHALQGRNVGKHFSSAIAQGSNHC
eukprot:1160542-Pelagomonas_calceolata.AAC.7